MVKKGLVIVGLLLIVVTAGCAARGAAQANTGGASASTTGTPQPGRYNTLESRLAPGILSLEGTGLAVTRDQALQLLPLWQKVKTLDANGPTSSTDLQTVYKQIETIMTADQISEIKNMSFTSTQLQVLMRKFNISIAPGAGFGGAQGTQSPEQQATRAAIETQFASGTGIPNGGRPNGGGNGTAFPTQSADQRATRQAETTLTPGGGRGFGGGNGAGFGGGGFGAQVFIDPVITLLTQITGG